MKQLELDFYEEILQRAQDTYKETEKEFPVNELDSIIISYQSPYANGFSILNEEDNSDWFTLLLEFTKTLNKADFSIDVEQVEGWIETLRADYKHKG